MVSAGSLQLCSPHGAPIFSSPRALSPAHTLKLGEKWVVLGLFWGLWTAAAVTRWKPPSPPSATSGTAASMD